MTNISFEYLKEPKLQFGQYFEHEDTKTGLAEYGPFGLCIPGLHPTEIKLGFIGTRETIAKAKDWITECSAPIESNNVQAQHKSSEKRGETLFHEGLETDQPTMRLNKILNRDFIGFNQNSSFRSSFQMNPRWDQDFTPKELDKILRIEPKSSRIWQLVDFFETYIKSLATTSPRPTIIILALTAEIEELADAVQISGNYYLNFRRAIKGRAMRWGVPIQLLRYRTAVGKDKSLQEKSLRAWNFCTAQYYKADGVPWRVPTIEPDTCFIGVSFYVARDLQDNMTMRSSVAQAFDHLSQSLVLRGDPFLWNERIKGKSPHLTQSAAFTLI